MNEFPSQPSVLHLLRYAREQIDKSVAITKHAEDLANNGESSEAASIMLEIEQPLYEAMTFINAASLFNRISSA